MTTAVLLAGACVVFFLGIETRNRSLEDIEINGDVDSEARERLARG
jgi:MFS transporter, putative metabolite:H+ symporter